MIEPKQKSGFPKNFLWGTSTSSHQVEGGNHNQWTVFELATAAERAKTAPKRLSKLSNWEKISDRASDPANYVSNEADEHYERYESDFDIVADLNMNAFRFSVEWSRVEPQDGQWDEKEIEHYRKYIRALKKRNIEPILNLWHWTNPVWFEERGAFTKRSNLYYFMRFAAKLIDELGEDLNYVLILNEPNNYAWFGYVDGKWAPGSHSYLQFLLTYRNLISAHRQTYRIIKEIAPHLKVSSAPQVASNEPKNPSSKWHRFNAWFADYASNWFWLDFTKKYQDFIGFNFYFKNYISGFGVGGIDNPTDKVNDMGWYMEPYAIQEAIAKVAKRYPNVPIIVAENGVADEEDQNRRWWIEETVRGLKDAVDAKIPLVGYFHWSLIDNFEWDEGWWPKFGLVSVDRKHGMKRTVRPSAKWFGKLLGQIRQ